MKWKTHVFKSIDEIRQRSSSNNCRTMKKRGDGTGGEGSGRCICGRRKDNDNNDGDNNNDDDDGFVAYK